MPYLQYEYEPWPATKQPPNYYWKILLDLLGPAHNWPNEIRRILASKLVPRNKEDFAVVLFLLANGINPELILGYFRDRWNAHRKYDTWRNIQTIIAKYMRGSYFMKYTYWNIQLQKTMMLAYPAPNNGLPPLHDPAAHHGGEIHDTSDEQWESNFYEPFGEMGIPAVDEEDHYAALEWLHDSEN